MILTWLQHLPLQFIFGVQVYCATLLNLYFQQRKPHFVWRLLIGSAVVLTLAYVIPDLYLGNILFVNFFIMIAAIAGLYLFTTDADDNELVFGIVMDLLLQQFAENLTWVTRLILGIQTNSAHYYWISAICYLIVYTAGFLLNRYQHEKYGTIHSKSRKLLAGGCAVFLLSYVLKRIIQVNIPDMTSSASQIAFISINLYSAILDVLLVVLLNISNTVDTQSVNERVLQELLRQEQKNYSSVVENLENINIKCHDMKHQLRLMQQLDVNPERDKYVAKLQHEVDLYERTPKTGNVALDATLADKVIYCAENDIAFTYTVNPSGLSHLEVTDLYALIGNAVDNAIECVIQYPPDQRLITLRIDSSDSYIKIQLENYCEKAPAIQQGHVQTSKADRQNHGFGLRSIESIAEKYNGFMDIIWEDNIFYLNVLLLPEA